MLSLPVNGATPLLMHLNRDKMDVDIWAEGGPQVGLVYLFSSGLVHPVALNICIGDLCSFIYIES